MAASSAGLERFEKAADLWPQLVARAGLTGARKRHRGPYDESLLVDLQQRLFPDKSGALDTLISGSELSAEELLRAFFATLEPFARMKEDILKMLAEAGASRSGDSLHIRFDFTRGEEPLDLLLEQFRMQMEAFALVATPAILPIEYARIWQLARAGFEDVPRFSYLPVGRSRPAAVLDWLDSYNNGASFAPLTGGWQTEVPEVDDRLGRAVELMNALLARFECYGHTHDELRRATEDGGRDKLDDSGFSVSDLWQIESDFWPRAIGAWICRVHDALAAGEEQRLTRVCEMVDEILPPRKAVETTLARVLEDVLDLPVWKHRHEVYAVWLGAQLHLALRDLGWRFRFHLVEGRLEFAFRGVHLATLGRGDREPELYWWTELRTEHSNLPNHRRRIGIQPDYRVLSSPQSAPDPTILLEAKQHLRSSNKEFREAIEDYAHASPKAGVLLANHGPCSSALMSTVAPEARARSAAYGDIHPGHADAVAAFRLDLARVIDCALAGRVARAFELPCEVQLIWGASPADLDLHLYRQGGGHVFYGERRLNGVEIGADVQTGHGPEKAILHDATGIYSVAVHQFSEDGDLSACGAIVEVAWGHKAERTQAHFEVPFGQGRWWHVADIDLSTGAVTPVQLRRSDPPG